MCSLKSNTPEPRTREDIHSAFIALKKKEVIRSLNLLVVAHIGILVLVSIIIHAPFLLTDAHVLAT